MNLSANFFYTSETFSFIGRRDSGGSLSSLFKSSKSKPEKPNRWTTREQSQAASSLGHWKSKHSSVDVSYRPYSQSKENSIRYESENYLKNRQEECRVIRPNLHAYSSTLREKNEYVTTNEKIDYKTLFEREKQEKEV